jgi:hypothetical protein
MGERKGSIPLSFPNLNNEGRVLNQLAGAHVWDTVIDAGHSPTRLVIKSRELIDGNLAVGFFHDEDDDFDDPIEGLGFVIPMGFWHTTDGRMPLNYTGLAPPSGYIPSRDKSLVAVGNGAGDN